MKEPNSPRGLVPAPAFGRLDASYNAYLSELDPRGKSERSKAVCHALALSTDTRFREFLTRLSEPRYRRYTLATVAKTCDISLPEFAQFWQKAQVQRALVKAQDALPTLTDDLVTDSRTKDVACERCDGFGWVYAEDGVVPNAKVINDRQIRVCPMCGGKGTVQKPGDIDSRKMLLEMTGLTKKGAAVQITQNFGGASHESSVDRLSRVTFDIDAEDISDG